MASGNGKHPGFGFDDDEDERRTPNGWPSGKVGQRIVIPPLPNVLLPPANTDPPTKRHIADVWKTAVVSCWALTVVGILSALQLWPYEVTLTAVGTITGAWTLGSLLGKRS